MSGLVSFPRRLRQLAAERRDDEALAVIHIDGTGERLTWAELDAWTDQVASIFGERGVSTRSTVVVGYPNSLEHVVATWAAWKLGALVLPLSYRSPENERAAMLELAAPTAVAADWTGCGGAITREDLTGARALPVVKLPDVVAHPGKSVGSGGSTGRPKIIVDPAPWEKDPDQAIGQLGVDVGFQHARIQLVPGPMYHNMPFTWANVGLFVGQRVIIMERFDAAQMLDLVERERVEYMTLVPTMMKRAAELFRERSWDLSSLRGVLHSAATCPPWVKHAWLESMEPKRLWEGFGGTENIGITVIRGDDWLTKPGSVGRPYASTVRIFDDDGNDLPVGEIGEVFMRPDAGAENCYQYVGAPPAKTTPDGFVSLGDFGFLDDDGCLFPADRRVDLIITGGSNVYPAEVESALSSHPAVIDAVVIGLDDPEWGKRVHALVALNPGTAPTEDELREHARRQLAPYKVPKTWEFVDAALRDEAGKVRRRALVEARQA